jgi:hypothetical protein
MSQILENLNEVLKTKEAKRESLEKLESELWKALNDNQQYMATRDWMQLLAIQQHIKSIVMLFKKKTLIDRECASEQSTNTNTGVSTNTNKIDKPSLELLSHKISKKISEELLPELKKMLIFVFNLVITTSLFNSSKPSSEELKQVLLFLRKELFPISMTSDDMVDFSRYMQKVKEVVPDADQINDDLWERWVSIRTYYFNDSELIQRMGVSSKIKL